MLFGKNNRNSMQKAKHQYSIEAQDYLRKNGLIIVQKICDGVLGSDVLEEEKVKEFLGQDYPIAPHIDKSDVIGQFVCLLEQAGYNFSRDDKGNICFKDVNMYNAIVQNHLKMSGSYILSNLADACEECNGRISYNRLHLILGFHYPKAPYISKTDKNLCMIMFLKATELPFCFDETYVYLP